jgi:predicted phage tail component-like protein
MIDASFKGVDLSDAVPEVVITNVRRPLLGAQRHVFVDAPGKVGSWVFPDVPGDGVLALDVVVLVDDEDDRRAALRELALWAVGAGEPDRLILSDEPDRFYEATLVTTAEVFENQYDAVTTIEYRVYPYTYEIDGSTEQLNIAAFPASGSFTIDDDVVALPVFQIRPTNGTLTALTLTVNGDTLTWSGSPALTSGQTLTINSISSTATRGVSTDSNLTGAFDPALVDMTDVNGVFPVLQPGLNNWSITRTGTATTAVVDINWRRRFV